MNKRIAAFGAAFLLLAAFSLAPVRQVAAFSFTPLFSVKILHSLIDVTPIGSVTPSTGAFTSLSSTSGALNGTIGATTPSTGAFTTSIASGGYTGNLTGNVSGNAGTATALQSTPTNCGTTGTAYGIGAGGNALCNTVATTQATQGSTLLPNGLILKWKLSSHTWAANERSAQTESWTTPFPNNCFHVQATPQFTTVIGGSNYEGVNFMVNPGSCTNSVSIYGEHREDGDADSSFQAFIFAIGN
jgi:hypothetical protein